MKKLVALLLLAAVSASLFTFDAAASESTAYTFTQSVNKEWIRTQDAYMPSGALLNGGELSSPNDLFIYGQKLYIADTEKINEEETGRVLIYDTVSGDISVIGSGFLKNPTGVFVNDEAVFVADRTGEAVYKLSHGGEILMKLSRPDSYLFSEKSQYAPTNVAVTKDGIIFVCGMGSYEGLMQFDKNGEFQGYFAANETEMTFTDRLQELLFNEEQMSSLLNRIPNPITNIDISDRDLVYSVTQLEATTLWSVASQSENAVKYHNMAGTDILSSELIEGEHNFCDIAAYKNDISFAVTSTGIIYEYDGSGNVIFSFGGLSTSGRSGLFGNAVAIDVDSAGNLYVLDKEQALVQFFYPTDFADTTHTALYNLSRGDYQDSEDDWLELLNLNGMSFIAHQGYGKLLYKQSRFSEAAEQFKIIKDKESYSECMWEIRNIWLQKNLPYLIIALAVIAAVYYTVRFLRKRGVIRPRQKKSGRFSVLFKRQCSYLTEMMKNPFDGFYYIKRKQHGGILSATVLYILTFAVYILDMFGRGFAFTMIDAENTYLLSVAVMFIVPAVLWVTGNFMVSAISEGEGTFRAVYTATAYSLVPYLILGPLAVISTFVFSLNESVVVVLLWTAGVAWSAVLLCISVKEIHNYTVKETVKIILLTLFFMIMAVIVCVIVYLIIQQTVIFIKDIVNEVAYRVEM